MRTSLYGHGLGFVRNGKQLLVSLADLRSFGWRLVLVGMLSAVLVSAGCDPEPPPTEDLGTILKEPPVLSEEESYDFPEDVARQVEEAKKNMPDADTM